MKRKIGKEPAEYRREQDRKMAQARGDSSFFLKKYTHFSSFFLKKLAHIRKKQTNICCTVGTPLFILNKESSEATVAQLCK